MEPNQTIVGHKLATATARMRSARSGSDDLIGKVRVQQRWQSARTALYSDRHVCCYFGISHQSNISAAVWLANARNACLGRQTPASHDVNQFPTCSASCIPKCRRSKLPKSTAVNSTLTCWQGPSALVRFIPKGFSRALRHTIVPTGSQSAIHANKFGGQIGFSLSSPWPKR